MKRCLALAILSLLAGCAGSDPRPRPAVRSGSPENPVDAVGQPEAAAAFPQRAFPPVFMLFQGRPTRAQHRVVLAAWSDGTVVASRPLLAAGASELVWGRVSPDAVRAAADAIVGAGIESDNGTDLRPVDAGYWKFVVVRGDQRLRVAWQRPEGYDAPKPNDAEAMRAFRQRWRAYERCATDLAGTPATWRPFEATEHEALVRQVLRFGHGDGNWADPI